MQTGRYDNVTLSPFSLEQKRTEGYVIVSSKQGLQEKLCKAEQDCFGAPETG